MSILDFSEVRIRTQIADIANLTSLINACLPLQGCIEIQHDNSKKEHAWHTHETDETIIVLDGSLRFYWSGGETICKAGDIIELPKGTQHGSIALDGGATYIITFEPVSLNK